MTSFTKYSAANLFMSSLVLCHFQLKNKNKKKPEDNKIHLPLNFWLCFTNLQVSGLVLSEQEKSGNPKDLLQVLCITHKSVCLTIGI